MNVLIADDHFAVREGLKTILVNLAGLNISVVGEASTLHELREALAVTPVDVVLLDISFPDGNGLELVRQWGPGSSSPQFLVVSMYRESSFVLKALQAGARGFVSKDSAGETLRRALESLRAGHVYLDPEGLDGLASQLRVLPAAVLEEQGVLAPLSAREKEVFLALAHGRNTKEIARTLSLSSKTVDNYRTSILAKLELGSVVDLVRFAQTHHLF
jgi:DNA-binding NarL/FixJ family response regulator